MHRTVSGGKQYHIACGKGDLAEYLLVPGDPDRVPKIAGFGISPKRFPVIVSFAVLRANIRVFQSLPFQVVLVQLAWLLLLTRLPA
jgi:uridine phosphorylase